jgi:tetratricopeptide (TPR) repeat protein
MKDFQNIIDQYERYLDGDLDEKSMSEMEEAIANDKELAELLQGHKLMLEGIRFAGRKELKGKMSEWDAAMSEISDQGKNEPKVRKLRWYYAAASVAILAFTFTFVYQYNANTYPRIANNHYEQYKSSGTSTRGANSENTTNKSILEQYALGNYEAVIEMAADLNVEEMSEVVQFHIACAYMGMKKYDEAIPLFEALTGVGIPNRNASKWFLALAYLYKDDPDKAMPLLNELASTQSKYSILASEVLNVLN